MIRVDWIDENEGALADPFKQELEALVKTVLGEEGIELPISLSVSLVDAAQMQQINLEHRGVDQVTDVLSFPMVEGRLKEKSPGDLIGGFDPEDGTLMLGDIVICPQRVLEQAAEFGHSTQREYGYMLAHGLLHLLGYDHEEENEKARMREMEEKALEAAGLKRE